MGRFWGANRLWHTVEVEPKLRWQARGGSSCSIGGSGLLSAGPRLQWVYAFLIIVLFSCQIQYYFLVSLQLASSQCYLSLQKLFIVGESSYLNILLDGEHGSHAHTTQKKINYAHIFSHQKKKQRHVHKRERTHPNAHTHIYIHTIARWRSCSAASRLPGRVGSNPAAVMKCFTHPCCRW
jgi:hypothetical protein